MSAGESNTCRCWPLVLGTLMITFGVTNLLLGIASTAASIELADIAGQVEGSREAIRIGETVRSISGGLFSIGDSGTGAVAKELLRSLPSPWLAGVLGVLRMLIAVGAIVLGSRLISRQRRALKPIVQWSVACFFLGLMGIWFVGLPTANLIGGIFGWAFIGIDASLHLVWPAIVFVRIRDIIATGEELEC